ncbi:hypothetical protein BDE40_1415 [Litoreibacter halocynthiae]|uniref:Uncharacterized protein n=1 Tax=Litoreibacter halocynthiae TaxID=1242689 RepID=A0A4R7LRE4_9RHOB|nr:hypothetical protein BDE40_1415 [Litoreibacter halocynthiae]
MSGKGYLAIPERISLLDTCRKVQKNHNIWELFKYVGFSPWINRTFLI